ncbi:MAG: rod-binding protein [Sphingobium sp.]
MTTLPPSMAIKSGVSAIGAVTGAVTGAVSDAAADEKAKLLKTAKAFEAVFVRQLIGSMRSAGFGDDLTGSSATEQFQEMSDAKTADNLSEKGTLGIAEMLLSRLTPKGAPKSTASAAATTAALPNQGSGK